MPSNLVKTPSDEKKWDRAKSEAQKTVGAIEGDEYALVNHIYQNMKKHSYDQGTSAVLTAAGLQKEAGLWSKLKTLATGRVPMYHGTSGGRAAKILREGIQPGQRGGIIDAVAQAADDPGFRDINEALTFATKDKGMARQYATQQSLLEDLAPHVDDEQKRRMIAQTLSALPPAQWVQQARGRAKVLETSLPVYTQRGAGRFVPNPEATQGPAIKAQRGGLALGFGGATPERGMADIEAMPNADAIKSMFTPEQLESVARKGGIATAIDEIGMPLAERSLPPALVDRVLRPMQAGFERRIPKMRRTMSKGMHEAMERPFPDPAIRGAIEPKNIVGAEGYEPLTWESQKDYLRALRDRPMKTLRRVWEHG
jgi:hypothetical protein